MKLLSEKAALEKLYDIRSALRDEVAAYEEQALSCTACDHPGACCLDEHFVNVHISRLEAAAIVRSIEQQPPSSRVRVRDRVLDSIERYGLREGGDSFSRTFACPLFERGVGCLVHTDAKPVPCMVHACYESKSDLPPEDLQMKAEVRIDDLNARTYGTRSPLLPLPVALEKLGLCSTSEDVSEHKSG
jgi:hypothetical protein